MLIQHDGRNNLAEDSVAMPWLALAVDVMNLRRRTGRLEAVDTERIAEMVISLISE
ncbi:MAG: hypothetical protein GY733_05425 [bacterium]|nr:hypothetical protein [bacterium]